MSGDVSWIDLLEAAGLVASKHTVCSFIPAILVKNGNPKNIKSLKDIVKPGIRLGLGVPEVLPIGKIAIRIFEKNKIKMEEVKKNLAFNLKTKEENNNEIVM
ncbi:TPA: hypothetical protein EYP66_20165 [Candidatus Poribacteria bacterium]|nr:hypothetical protein [Candidatus Poribacteria bacterium]